ncbi:hypothetical protein D9M71_155940 [compost metagenome]
MKAVAMGQSELLLEVLAAPQPGAGEQHHKGSPMPFTRNLSLTTALSAATFTLLAFAGTTLAAPAPAAATSSDWRENYAYHVGVLAYTYGYPALHLAELRYGTDRAAGGLMLNTFKHYRKLSDLNWKQGGSPNRDTLYSSAFVNLNKGPVVVSVGNAGTRYYSLALNEFYSDVIGYIGTRATGNEAGAYLLASSDWQGQPPADVKAIYRSPTPWVLLAGRVEAHSDADLDDANRLQDSFRITPLADWGKPAASAPVPVAPMTPELNKNDPLAAFKTMNLAMTENPPPAQDQALMKLFAEVNLGPGHSPAELDSLDPGTRQGLARAIVDGKKLLVDVTQAGGRTKTSNGWAYGQENWGRMAQAGDYLGRAATQSYSGIIENYVEEAVKLRTYTDEQGRPLDGDSRYVIHFTADQLPQVDAFWSLTAYGPDYNLLDTPAKRFAITDHQPLQKGADGSLTLYLQKDSPGADKESNWISLAKGPFNLFLRAYLPHRSLIEQSWQPPAIQRLN